MLGISEILQNKIETGEKLEKSERAQITKEIYQIYTSPSERIHRRKENWKRYVAWLKKNRKKHTNETVIEFKKTANKKMEGKYLQEYKSLWYLTSHIKTKDLYYILSEMKSNLNRGKSASAYIINSTRVK